MTKRQDDPIQAVPRRVLVVSLIATVALVLVALVLGWPLSHVLIGFWVGVIVNLIGFRLMTISARKLLEGNVSVLSALGGGGFFGRFSLYALGLFAMAQLSLYALLATAIGLSMVGLVLKLQPFFSLNGGASKVD